MEGTSHGFLEIANSEGKVIAQGDLLQTAHGDRITSRLLFRFKDGSIDDETTEFSQAGAFHLISYRHIQKGPFFPHPTDLSVDIPKGQITIRSTREGKEEVQTEQRKLPPDLYNGMVIAIVKNLRPETPVTKVSMIVPALKPRLVTLAISPLGTEQFELAGASRKALKYEIKIELGGISGAVAPLIGKQPPNVRIWIVGGERPTFVREQGPLYEGSPIFTISLARPTFPADMREEDSRQ